MSSLRDLFGFMHGNILVLTVTRVIGMFCRSMVFPYASLYILALGGEAAQIGLVNSLMPLAGLIVFPLAGYIADHVGRVKLIALSGYLSGAILLMYVFAPSWQILALTALLQGFMVFHFPATSAIVADSLSPQNRGTGIATINTVAGALAIVSPYVAGAAINIYGVDRGMRYLYALLSLANLVSGTVSLRFLKETGRRSDGRFGLSDISGTFRNAYGGIPAMLRMLPRPLRALAVVIVLGFMANAIAGPFWVVYAVEHIGLSSVEWGLILLVEAALRNLMFIPAGIAVDRYGRTKSIMASLALALTSIPLFVLSTGFGEVLLIRSAVAVTNVFFIPACSALMADMVPRDIRGRVMSALGRGTVMTGAAAGGVGGPGMGFVVTMPVVTASIAGGYLYAYDPSYPWLFVLAAIAASIILTALFVRDPREAEI